MATYDLKITLHKANYSSATEFEHDIRGFCSVFYQQVNQCTVRQLDNYAVVFVSSNDRHITFDHSTNVGCIEIERGDYTAECGIDISSLSRVFEEDGAVDLMVSKLKRNTRYICGHVHGVYKTPITAELLRNNNWDKLDEDHRLFLLRRLLVDIYGNEKFDYFEMADDEGRTGDIYSLIENTVEQLFGPDADSVWGRSDDDDDDDY